MSKKLLMLSVLVMCCGCSDKNFRKELSNDEIIAEVKKIEKANMRPEYCFSGLTGEIVRIYPYPKKEDK